MYRICCCNAIVTQVYCSAGKNRMQVSSDSPKSNTIHVRASQPHSKVIWTCVVFSTVSIFP